MTYGGLGREAIDELDEVLISLRKTLYGGPPITTHRWPLSQKDECIYGTP